MSGRVSRAAIIRAIALKDLSSFARDRLWWWITPGTLALAIVGYHALPASVVESVRVGLVPPEMAEPLAALEGREASQGRGFELVGFEDEAELAAAVSGELGGEAARGLRLGIAFPRDFAESVRAGERGRVSVYLSGAVPTELRGALASAIRELAWGLQATAGGTSPAEAFPVRLPDPRTIVLGEDRAGAQVPLREKLRPLLALMILLVESMALSGLVAVEIERRTAMALMVTPARSGDVLAAKGLVGALLGLVQVALFLLATRGFEGRWLLVSLLVLVGASMMSAVGMIVGSLGKDFMITLYAGMALIIPLMIPAIALLFPGSPSLWVQALPTFGLAEGFLGAVGYGRGWGEVAPQVGLALAWTVGLAGAAVWILDRRVSSP